MEELQTSLFSELHNSEGAKRLQQRFCGLEVVLTFNFMVVVSIIMMNKLVGSHIIQLVFILNLVLSLINNYYRCMILSIKGS